MTVMQRPKPRAVIIPAVKTLAQIRSQLAESEFEFSRHAFGRAVERNISELEIREAGAQAEVIEDYPADKYFPSVLMLGFTKVGRPLHIQVSRADTLLARIITVYEPDPGDWVEFRNRRA